MLAHMFILEMGPHRNLPLEAAVADWAVVWQGFRVGREVFGQMIFSEKPAKNDKR